MVAHKQEGGARMFDPGTLVKNADASLKYLDEANYTFRVVSVDGLGIAALEVIGNDALGLVYLWARDLKPAEPDIVEVS